MPLLPLRKLSPVGNVSLAEAWLERIAHRLEQAGSGADEGVAEKRALLCRETLTELTFPEYAGNWEEALTDERVPMGTRVALSALDPRNITLEPEFYADCN